MILSFITEHSQGPSGRLKTLGFALGFQHFPRDPANVNEWKIMFDPSIVSTNLAIYVLEQKKKNCYHPYKLRGSKGPNYKSGLA